MNNKHKELDDSKVQGVSSKTSTFASERFTKELKTTPYPELALFRSFLSSLEDCKEDYHDLDRCNKKMVWEKKIFASLGTCNLFIQRGTGPSGSMNI